MAQWNWERWSDVGGRVATAAMFSWFAYQIGLNTVETGRLSGLVYLSNELLVVILVVSRRFAHEVDRTAFARIAAMTGTLGPLLARPDGRYAMAPESFLLPLAFFGLVIVIAGKLSLGRSFGTLPANRGIVSSGAYRMVRHPIYLGYLFVHLSFLIANATPWNVFVLVFSDCFLFVRTIIEERTLDKDAGYRDYMYLVRWRIIPGVF